MEQFPHPSAMPQAPSREQYESMVQTMAQPAVLDRINAPPQQEQLRRGSTSMNGGASSESAMSRIIANNDETMKYLAQADARLAALIENLMPVQTGEGQDEGASARPPGLLRTMADQSVTTRAYADSILKAIARLENILA